MRYGEIITTAYYGIKLSPREVENLDAHFLAASHHRYRANTADSVEIKRFHAEHYWRHVQLLMLLISSGDFSEVFRHPSVVGPGCDKPAGWLRVFEPEIEEVLHPSDFDHLLPSPTLFDDMCSDSRHGHGESHPYDILLSELGVRPSQISLEVQSA